MRPATRHKAAAAWVQVGDGARLELHHTPWWRHIYRDFRRYRVTADPALRTIFLTQGFWASSVYRVSRAALEGSRVLAWLARPVAAVAQKLVEMATGISIPPQCEIGDGLYIGHYGSIILAPDARIGHNCSLAQNVTIGDDVVVCAGSVVSRSVPARAVVMGNPARVVSYDGSFDYVFYDGMDVDPARRASLEKVRSLNVGPA